MTDLEFAWLEITGKCQLTCAHCYAESGPGGTHGTMRTAEWLCVIDQIADLGGSGVQFIGGEPTLHRDLPSLMEHALARQLHVEVFSNLVHVSRKLWETFEQPGVRLATSYYSDSAREHDAITGGRGSHARTKANIVEALDRAIPLRVGVVDVSSQRTQAARIELRSLGVRQIGSDSMRGVGRGASSATPAPDQLCGRCGHGAVAVSPTGDVWPCVFARWTSLGNVRQTPLGDILRSTAIASTGRGPSCWPQGAGPCAPNDR
ncbi:radical SAM/SPASM domain-containing protein [Lentzea tibetensis]|uniref:radical SAM/SPASM domain-containing protein n=1 Tax=Lentzea tibetensis TaxID=2591470 RepID=UPI0016456978|nr:radical SAM protein [Lentzea tibetensis]